MVDSQLMGPRAVVTGLFVLLLVGAGSAATASQLDDPAATQTVPSDRPTENVTERLTVEVSTGSDTATLEAFVAYPARSAAEADAARNDTLDPDWFRGSQRIQRLFNETAESSDRLTHVSTSVRHEPQSWAGSGDPSPEYGWILVRHEAAWKGYVESGDTVTIGRAYARALDESWELRVIVPSAWEPSTVGGDPVVEPVGETATRYRWTITRDQPSPFLVFEPPTTSATSADGAFGVDGGFVVTLLVVIATITLARFGYRHSRR